jgi:hypothetical protein
MKKLTKVILSTAFAVLIIGFAQSISADEIDIDIIPASESKFQTHVQVVVRNAQDQLVSVSESTTSWSWKDSRTDSIFNKMVGHRENITVDNIIYEKFRLADKPNPDFLTSDYIGLWHIFWCDNYEEYGYQCMPIFQATTPNVTLEQDDNIMVQWTILQPID